jgi:hypothetical protein
MDFLKFSKLDLKVFLVGLLLANLPYWMVFQFNLPYQPIIIYESIILLVLIQRKPLIGFIFFLSLTGLYLLILLSNTYYFSDPLVFLKSFKYFQDFNALKLINYKSLLVVGVFYLSGLWLFKYLSFQKNIKLNTIFYSFIIIFIADILNSSSFYSFGNLQTLNFNIGGSPLRQFIVNVEASKKSSLVRRPQGYLSDLVLLAKNNNKNILVIIVESFGEASDPKVRLLLENKLLEGNQKLSDVYSIKSGRIPFYGSTTTAELNTLCMVTGDYNNLNNVNTSDCIPKSLPAEWQVIGIHGFTGDMFARSYWWPLIGLRTNLFAQDVSTNQCGEVFRGACDQDVLNVAKTELDGGVDRFVYVLTLNTHLPNQSIEIPDSVNKICNQTKLNQDGCNFLATMTITLEAVNNTLHSINNKPYIYLVGDHAPPFINTISRGQFSQKEVPFYIFIPRS